MARQLSKRKLIGQSIDSEKFGTVSETIFFIQLQIKVQNSNNSSSRSTFCFFPVCFKRVKFSASDVISDLKSMFPTEEKGQKQIGKWSTQFDKNLRPAN